jgi:AraC-like DNA-binding protein
VNRSRETTTPQSERERAANTFDLHPVGSFVTDLPHSSTAATARVSVKLIAPFIDAARSLGLRSDLALAGVGLTRSDLENPDLRVSHSLVDQMLRVTIAATGEHDIGLLAAEHLQASHLDVLEYAARAQPTLRGALEHSFRYYGLLHDGFEADLKIDDERATLTMGFGDLTVDDAAFEFALAVHLMAARRMTGNSGLAPLEAHFIHPRRKNTSVHQRIFRSPLLFAQRECALVYARATLDTPLVAADTGLASILDRHAAESLQKLGRNTNLPQRVRELVRRDLTGGKLNAESVARRLGMSARTLHRHLLTDGTSYRALVDDIRREIALRCLRDPQLSLREIGYLLGFTTGPAFHRAFRRWTGKTASAYRIELIKSR